MSKRGDIELLDDISEAIRDWKFILKICKWKLSKTELPCQEKIFRDDIFLIF